MMNEKIREKPMYCPQCGTLNIGYEDENGKICYECKNPRCRLVFVRIPKSRRHESVDLYRKSACKEGERKLNKVTV